MANEDEHPILQYVVFMIGIGLVMLLLNCDACNSSHKYDGMTEDDRIDDYN